MKLKTVEQKLPEGALDENSMLNYISYFNRKVRPIGMKATLKQIKYEEEHLQVIDLFFPKCQIEIYDEGNQVFNFIYDAFSSEDMERLSSCFKTEVSYYVKSKFFSNQEFDYKRLRKKNPNPFFKKKSH